MLMHTHTGSRHLITLNYINLQVNLVSAQKRKKIGNAQASKKDQECCACFKLVKITVLLY